MATWRQHCLHRGCLHGFSDLAMMGAEEIKNHWHQRDELVSFAWSFPKSFLTHYLWFLTMIFFWELSPPESSIFLGESSLLCSLVNLSEGPDGTQSLDLWRWPYAIFQWCTFTFGSLYSILGLFECHLERHSAYLILCIVLGIFYVAKWKKRKKEKGKWEFSRF